MSNVRKSKVDVVVVGSGPNGLAAAITLARAGRSVIVLEAADEIGGACRSAELTLPGYVHDIGSSIHPLAVASPFMRTIDWAGKGLRWVTPPAAVAHPLDDGRAAVAWNDLDRAADGLGADAGAYRSMFGPLVKRFDDVVSFVMQPPTGVARSVVKQPKLGIGLGPQLALPATVLARRFSTDEGRALFAGHAAHSVAPLNHPFTAGFGLLLGTAAHAVGWPFPAGGAGEITRVLAETLIEAGGTIQTGHPIEQLADLPPADAVLFALTPRQVASIVGNDVPSSVGSRLGGFRYGPGLCKVDYLVDGPIPWTNPDVGKAGTVHLGGTLEQVAEAEAEVAAGHHAERPFTLLAQHSLFDPSRSPGPATTEAPLHTVWAYCHVPNGSTLDVSAAIDDQIERFAPGFGATIRARRVTMTPELEAMNANLVGGDVGGGSYTGTQALFRPWPSRRPHHLSGRYYLGSASATPGGGVHGMGGLLAAETILADRFGSAG